MAKDPKKRRKTKPADAPSGLRQLAGQLNDDAMLVAQEDAPEFSQVEDDMALVEELRSVLNAGGASLPDDAPIGDVLQAALDALAAAPADKEASEDAKAAAELKAKLGVEGKNLATEVASLKVQADQVPELQERLAAIETERSKTHVASLIAAKVATNQINPNDEADVQNCRWLAETDEERFEAIVGNRPAYAEAGTITGGKDVSGTPKGARGKLIAEACKEFDDATAKGQDVAFGASKVDYVAGALQIEQMDNVLTDTELATVKGGAK